MLTKPLVIASANPHKIEEIFYILEGIIPVISMRDIGCDVDIPETDPTIEGNAILKADYLFRHYGVDCFGDDSGLEIAALGGEPGVKSARYAGENKHPGANIDLVLEKLKGVEDRSARFKTVIALWYKGERHLFEGIINGKILHSRKGDMGFGYDPIFQPEGYEVTFAQMTDAEKNSVSHRYKALMAMKGFLIAKEKKG